MKHIGIVNVTAVGACICANEIVAQAAKVFPNGEHPEFTLHAFPFSQYRAFLLRQDWEGFGKTIVESLKKLKTAGAEFAIIPSNTPHFAIELIRNESPIEVMSILDITAEECVARGFKTVAVLGTKFTMQGGLYNQVLSSRGISVVVPDSDVIKKIDSLIMNEIIPSKVNPQTVDEVRSEIRSLRCDAVILGCTELPEVYSEKNLSVSAIDTTRLLGKKAFEFATKGLV